RRALALDGGIATPAAGAQVHRPDELEARREAGPALRARDDDLAVLERLPERFERGSLELGQLVEQQHATVRERRLAGTRAAPANRASGADAAGQMILGTPALRAPSATAKTPRTGRNRPSRASSPTDACRSSSSIGTFLAAARIASAIGRSNADPSFRCAAGA